MVARWDAWHRSSTWSSLGASSLAWHAIREPAREFVLIFPMISCSISGRSRGAICSPCAGGHRKSPPPPADLTAQVKTVSTSDLSDMTSAASSFMIPYSTNPLKIVISSFVADQNNIGKVA